MRIQLNTMEEHLDNQQSTRTFAHHFFIPKGMTTKRVKILLDKISDVPVFRTHTVTRTSKNGKRYFQEVNCIGDGCPLCEHAQKTDGQANVSFAHDRLVIPLIDFDFVNSEGQKTPVMSYWVRSSNFYRTVLATFTSRFAGLLDGYVDVMKSGTGQGTTYALFPANDVNNMPPVKSNAQYLEDFGVDMDEDMKTVVYDMTAEQMAKLIPAQETVTDDVPFYDSTQATRRVSTHGF